VSDADPHVSVIVLAYGDEPLLKRCISEAQASVDVDVEVVLVDNGCSDKNLIAEIAPIPGVVLIEPGSNLGFAAGANLGVRRSTGDYAVLLNSDAVPEPNALALLVAPLVDPSVGLVTASLRLLREPDRLNSCGNPVHFSGLSWAGCFGQAASDHDLARPVASASGAALACRRETWELLGGLCDQMFAYHEDTDLSLRCWTRGLSVLFVPEAVVLHDYEFSRNDAKLGLLERNRLITVLTVYERRTLLVLAPYLFALELAVSLLAVRQDWFGRKVAGWWWLLRHGRWLRQRRRTNRAGRTVSDSALIPLLTGAFEPGQEFGGRSLRFFNLLSEGYWAFAKRAIDRAR